MDHVSCDGSVSRRWRIGRQEYLRDQSGPWRVALQHREKKWFVCEQRPRSWNDQRRRVVCADGPVNDEVRSETPPGLPSRSGPGKSQKMFPWWSGRADTRAWCERPAVSFAVASVPGASRCRADPRHIHGCLARRFKRADVMNQAGQRRGGIKRGEYDLAGEGQMMTAVHCNLH